jgi:hypothetical protein
MHIKKLLINLSAIFISLFLIGSGKVLAANPVTGYRLNTVINQASDFTLTLTSIGLENGPYVGYTLNYPNNFYLIKIIDKNNAELFSGKTPRSYQTLPPDFVPVTDFTPQTIIANPINLLLSYFNEATKIQLFDENNVLKLEINLADHKLQGLKYRYAACDLCGYCSRNQTVPQSWSACQKCLYPNIANTDPAANETLLINPETNLPTTPMPGRSYTFLGCIEGGGGFTQSGAGGGVVQKILNIIFSMAGGIAFLYLLYGAFVIATSQADPEKLNYGKRLVYGAIVGLIFTLGSVFIINFIASGVLKIPGFGEGASP